MLECWSAGVLECWSAGAIQIKKMSVKVNIFPRSRRRDRPLRIL